MNVTLSQLVCAPIAVLAIPFHALFSHLEGNPLTLRESAELSYKLWRSL